MELSCYVAAMKELQLKKCNRNTDEVDMNVKPGDFSRY